MSDSDQKDNNTDSSPAKSLEGDVMSDKENEVQAESVEAQNPSANQLEIPDNTECDSSQASDAAEKADGKSATEVAQVEAEIAAAPEDKQMSDDSGSEDSEDRAKAKVKAAAPAAEEAQEDLDEEADDPLGEAYDLEKGDKLPSQVHQDGDKLPWKSKVESAKEFFNTEILYRHDILLAEERKRLAGSYRIELKGFQGGIWSLDVGEDIEVVNRREDADIVLAMQQKDFLRVVNGDLNPQLALLSRKIKVTGDVKKAVALQSLLAPATE